VIWVKIGQNGFGSKVALTLGTHVRRGSDRSVTYLGQKIKLSYFIQEKRQLKNRSEVSPLVRAIFCPIALSDLLFFENDQTGRHEKMHTNF
jgi:hypothetical protein